MHTYSHDTFTTSTRSINTHAHSHTTLRDLIFYNHMHRQKQALHHVPSTCTSRRTHAIPRISCAHTRTCQHMSTHDHTTSRWRMLHTHTTYHTRYKPILYIQQNDLCAFARMCNVSFRSQCCHCVTSVTSVCSDCIARSLYRNRISHTVNIGKLLGAILHTVNIEKWLCTKLHTVNIAKLPRTLLHTVNIAKCISTLLHTVNIEKCTKANARANTDQNAILLIQRNDLCVFARALVCTSLYTLLHHDSLPQTAPHNSICIGKPTALFSILSI